MGEPMLNIDNVVEAVRIINGQLGIGARSITISTVGVKGQLRRLAQLKLQCVLAVSLHAPSQELRCDSVLRFIIVAMCLHCVFIQTPSQRGIILPLGAHMHAPGGWQPCREKLVPSAKAYPLKELLNDCTAYFQATSRRVTFEYTMLRGENDSAEQVRARPPCTTQSPIF